MDLSINAHFDLAQRCVISGVASAAVGAYLMMTFSVTSLVLRLN